MSELSALRKDPVQPARNGRLDNRRSVSGEDRANHEVTLIESNVERIAAMQREALEARTLGTRLISAMVAFGGTPLFGLVHILWFGFWITANVGLIRGVRAFDPYPFPFLTFVVSLEAIFLSIGVLISENQALSLAERRAHLDLQVNLLSEQESTATLRLVREIATHLGVTPPADCDTEKMVAETDVADVVEQLERQMPTT